MEVIVAPDKNSMGAEAASAGAELVRQAVADRGSANIIVATGASQFEMLAALIEEKDVPWSAVTLFHLDEYVGIPITHPASFRLYLWQRFHKLLPLPVRAFHYIDPGSDAPAECGRLARLIAGHPIDVAFIGIGENAHVAFNDPPADFETESPYIVVNLDDACRRQQFGEGWFASFDLVPEQAISMSCRQIMKSATIICTVPDQRKAEAVRASVEGPIVPTAPASILQRHPKMRLFLDPPAASLLKKK